MMERVKPPPKPFLLTPFIIQQVNLGVMGGHMQGSDTRGKLFPSRLAPLLRPLWGVRGMP